MKLSWAFIKQHVAAVVFVCLVFVGGWQYLEMKKDVFEKDASARLDTLREREVDLAKDRAAFAESLAVLRLERIQLAEDRSQLEQLKRELKDKTQLLTREGRQLEDREKLIARKVRLDRNMQLYSEQYASVTSGDATRACDPGRTDKISGARSLLSMIRADAKTLGDTDIGSFVRYEFFHKFSSVAGCIPDHIKQRDGPTVGVGCNRAA
jgi:chromosome segregation ATPase